MDSKTASDESRVSPPIYNLLPTEIEGFRSLAELALDLRWSWNRATDEVWRQLDPELWEITHSPWVVLLTASRDQINLSELDGWWAEAYAPEGGWALGDGPEHGDDPAWDAVEAEALYELLEREVIPAFYTRDERGIPTAWGARMRKSMAPLTPRFSASRAVCEYTEERYLPAAAAYRERAADKGAVGRQMVDWQHNLEQKWATLRFGEVKAETRGEQHVFEVQVCLNGIAPKAVRVELYADGINGGAPVRQQMNLASQSADASASYVYSAALSAARPPAGYTPRARPHCDSVAVPLQADLILWQR